jgi:hypothetical protein
VHGPELQRIATGDGVLELSIFEAGVPPRFRLSGMRADAVTAETLREGGARQVLTRHIHLHRHGRGAAHGHWHDHLPATAHAIAAELTFEPPLHEHRHKTSARTALILILGSSPMVEGIPAFFAAGKYGPGLIVAMALVFAISTIATYMLLCVYSTAGLQRVRLGAFERYGEVLSGAFITLVGVAFWIWPIA